MVTPIRDSDVIAAYLADASGTVGHAEAVVRPRDTGEVAETVAYCAARGLPLTVSAGRTGTTAGARPDGGWVLSTERLRRPWRILDDRAEVDAGHLLGPFQDAVLAAGRLYPPDPTSRYECTVGGSLATNASGARSFRYGATRGWVERVTAVLADGTVVEAGPDDRLPGHWPVPRWREPQVKTAAGYAPSDRLVDVLVGSEGTLAVLTSAVLKLCPRPGGPVALVAWFDDETVALQAVASLRAAARSEPSGPVSPCAIEWLDRASLDVARARADVPDGAVAALMCEQEIVAEVGEDGHLAGWLDRLGALGARVDGTVVATDDAGREALRRLRHAVPAGVNEIATRNGMPKVGTDLSVPDDALPAMMAAYATAPVPSVLFGHVGDNHLHLNLLPRTADELARARAWYDDLARQAVALGGSVSGEHGIGKTKVRQLGWMVGEDVLASFRALKRAADPAGILGRGTLLAVV